MDYSKYENIIVLDIETTSLSHNGMICEIGIVSLNLINGKIEILFDQICREDGVINKRAWVFKNTNLTYEEVNEAPYLESFREELQNILDSGCPIGAWNQSFDFGFLESRNFKIPIKFWDAMHKLTPIMKIPHNYFTYKKPNVQEAYNYFNDDKYIEKHRALDDAIHEAEIIYKLNKFINSKKEKVLYMNEEEFGKLLSKFNSINTQIKFMSKIVGSIKDEIKVYTKDRNKKIIEAGGYRSLLNIQSRSYMNIEKVKDLIIEHGEDIDDYYYKKDIEILKVVKIVKTDEEVNVDGF